MMPCGAAASEDFYETRLRAGKEAYRAKRIFEAIDQFRIACFGFPDQPVLLAEGLARLALAQAAAGRMVDVDATLNRFIDLERRSAPYGKIKLEPDIEADFQALLLKRVTQETLLSMPSLAGLVETEEQKIAKLPPRQREKALEAAARREPKEVKWVLALARNAAERQEHGAVVRWVGRVLELDEKNAEALALRARARVGRRQYAEALADLKALPKESWEKWPELYADRLVCLVDRKDWIGAEQAVTQVPPKLMARADVVRAEQELAKERESREKRRANETTGIEKPATASETSVADKPARQKTTNEKAPRVEQPPLQELIRKGGSKATTDPPPERSATRKPAVASGNVSATTGRSSPSDILAESRRLLNAGKRAEAEKILTEALKSEPARRDLRLALLEVACLSGDWKTATAQVPLVSPLREGEETSMFYAAVVLYESGRHEEARPYMERVRSKVRSSPYVDYYKEKILGKL